MLFSATPSFRYILGAARNNQQLESGALLKGTPEHFKAVKNVRCAERKGVVSVLTHFSVLFHTKVSAPLSFTGAGFTWSALTDQ